MALDQRVIDFFETIKCNPVSTIEKLLQDGTFYKSEEIDAPSGIKPNMTYGQFKLEVALIQLNYSNKVSRDILFLLASREELENVFLSKISNEYGVNSSQYKDMTKVFTQIHSYHN